MENLTVYGVCDAYASKDGIRKIPFAPEWMGFHFRTFFLLPLCIAVYMDCLKVSMEDYVARGIGAFMVEGLLI